MNFPLIWWLLWVLPSWQTEVVLKLGQVGLIKPCCHGVTRISQLHDTIGPLVERLEILPEDLPLLVVLGVESHLHEVLLWADWKALSNVHESSHHSVDLLLLVLLAFLRG